MITLIKTDTKLFSLALVVSLSLVSLSACNKPALPPMAASTVTELVKTDVKIGEGAEAVAGQTVAVHYSGWLYDEAAPAHKGKPFDSSRERGSFTSMNGVATSTLSRK